MPAATTTATVVAPEPPQGQVWYRPTGDKVMEPFSNSITAAEHKIRNLEKRKLKLDQYRSEQSEGKTLNADQLAAVSKYNEVIQQLENNRELVVGLKQVHQQTIKFIKQEMRRETAERNKFVLVLQAVVDELQNPNVQRDVLHGEHGAPKINEEDLVELTELNKILKPSLREPDFAAKLETGAELVAKLFESRGKINNKPSQQVKTLIDSIAESQYFTSGPVSSVPIDTIQEETSSAAETQQQQQEQQHQQLPVHPPEAPMPVNNPVSAQMMINQDREMAFSFIQESQLEIESPHMDPAVVAVSSFVPPPQQIQPAPENNHVFKPPTPPTETLNNIQSGIRDMNLNHMNSNNGEEEEVTDWDDKTTYINNTNGNMEGDQDNTNGLDKGKGYGYRGRGNGRGGRGGRGNGYSSRPPRTSRGGGGFNNQRGGAYFRAERIGQSDAESVDYRGKGPRGGYSRSFRGNGNGPSSGGPSIRRGARNGPPQGGPPKPYNGIHEPRPEN